MADAGKRGSWLANVGLLALAIGTSSPSFGQQTPTATTRPPPADSTAVAGTASSDDAIVDAPVSNQAIADSAADTGAQEGEIVVTGIRGSLQRSIELKRNAAQVIDVITAEDIGKLPDQNVAESLQRVAGVQIGRKDGEGSTFTVRGISLNRVEINGRTFTGPTQGGTPALETLNPEILSGLEVIKSVTADSVEGSLGGTVNLRTKRPLELKDFVVSGRAQVAEDSIRGKAGYRASGLVSTKFADNTLGALLSVAYQNTYSEGQGYDSGGWTRTNNIDGNGDGVDDPNLFRPLRVVANVEPRDDKRLSINGALQWQPSDALGFTFEGTFSDFKRERQVQRYQIILNDNDVGAFALPDGTISRATYTGVVLRPLVYDEPTDFKSLSLGLSGKYSAGPLSVSGDVSYSRGTGTEGPLQASPFTPIIVPRAGRTVSASYDFENNAVFPNYSLTSNFNVDDLAQYQLAAIFDGFTQNRNTGRDARLDFDHDVQFGPVTRLEAGVRYEKVKIFSAAFQNLPSAASLLGVADRNGDGIITVDEIPSLVYNNRYSGGFLAGTSGDFRRDFPTGNVDNDTVRTAFAFPPTPLVSTTVNDVQEEAYAGYLKANFEGDLGAVPFSGNIGVRYVRSERLVQGFAAGGGAIVPVSFDSEFDNVLPSANVAFELTDRLTARGAAAKVVARPPLNDLGAGTTFQIVSNTGNGGNPNLQPFKATQYDATLEWYFAPASLLSVAVFYKDVNSFTIATVTDETIPGFVNPNPGGSNVFRITRPQNGAAGEIKGFEVNYQHALKFLPRPFDGLGIGASYTYADSSTPIIDQLSQVALPLPNLSKNSYSLIAYYENSRFGARVAYTYRDKYLVPIQGAAAAGSLYNDAFDQLDASLTFNISDQVKLIAEASNLTESINRRYVGTPIRTNNSNAEGRRFYGGVLVSF